MYYGNIIRRGGNHDNQGGGWVIINRSQAGRDGGQGSNRDHLYVVLAHPETKASDVVITGTTLVFDYMFLYFLI